jgi:heme exporter protein C
MPTRRSSCRPRPRAALGGGADDRVPGGGLVWGFFFTPDDYKQGATVKIIYLHVPAAMMAINAWMMMLVTSLIWIVRRHHVSALAAKAAAPVGLTFTLIALVTGALWGQPMWGTWWAWDPRLTSFLILALFYLGYIGIMGRGREPRYGGRSDLGAVHRRIGLCAAVALCGEILEPGAAPGFDHPEAWTRRRTSDPVYYLPLVVCIAGFVLLFVTLVLVRTRTEIRARRLPGPSGAGEAGMMPELGKYAVAVLGSYGASALLMAALVAADTAGGAARIGRALAEVEDGWEEDG